MTSSVVSQLLLLPAFSALAVTACRRFELPPIMGYLAGGHVVRAHNAWFDRRRIEELNLTTLEASITAIRGIVAVNRTAARASRRCHRCMARPKPYRARHFIDG